MAKYLILIASILLMNGCASLKIVPELVANGTINEKELSQTIVRNNIHITAKGGDAEILSYNLEGGVTSFNVIVDNRTDQELQIDFDNFLLTDNEGRQYFPLTPDKMKEIVSKNSYYLIPYPYVGFYYLEDYEKVSFQNRYTSDRPYFYEVYPQDIYTKSLPSGSIIPNAKVAGLIYFRIDAQSKKGLNLLFYKKGTSKSAPADFNFPFKIVK